MIKETQIKLKPAMKTSFEVVFSKSGELVGAINKKSLRVWNLATSECIANFNVLSDPSHFDFSPDDTRIIVKTPAVR